MTRLASSAVRRRPDGTSDPVAFLDQAVLPTLAVSSGASLNGSKNPWSMREPRHIATDARCCSPSCFLRTYVMPARLWAAERP